MIHTWWPLIRGWCAAGLPSLTSSVLSSITSLYRGVSKDDPSKVCAVMQAAPGVMEQFIADNTDMIAASGHVIESTVSQVFVAS